MPRNVPAGHIFVKQICAPYRRDAALVWPEHVPMRQRHPNYIREWRKHRGLTLEQLAERLHMHHSALSKVERGKNPYNQDLLERIADELNCEPVDLLIRNPSDPEAVWSIWDRISPPDRDTARRILEQLAQPKKDKRAG
jgi:transcriptional regulator with XRE-family HTH domain